VIVATTDSVSPRIVTPSGATSSARRSVPPISIRGDVEVDVLGNLERQRLDGDLAQNLREDAAFLHAGGNIAAGQVDGDRGVDRLVEPHLLQVDVRDAAAYWDRPGTP
jgi:hypothetical protein